MNNPPFPYHVVIRKRKAPADPFSKEMQEATRVYDGECDFENTRYPSYRDGVQIGKYKLYLPDNTIAVEKQDTVELSIYGRTIKGEVIDFFPTNFGLTITWDNINN